MNTKYTILLFIVGILVIYLKKCQKNVEYMAPGGEDSDEETINQIRIENNMDNYLKFKKVQDKINGRLGNRNLLLPRFEPKLYQTHQPTDRNQ